MSNISAGGDRLFRTKVRELREQAGYTSQKSFADAFGVAQTTVASWEGGKREPGYATTIRLADFFHVSVDYLLGRENTKKEPTPVPESGLSKDESDLIELFRCVPQEQRSAMLQAIEMTLRSQGLL